MNYCALEHVDIEGKRVAIRVDLNVPVENETITNDERIRAILPTLHYCLNRNTEVILLSHFGRPKGVVDPKFSLRPVAKRLAELLQRPVPLVNQWRENFLSGQAEKKPKIGSVSLFENLRFEDGEEENDPTLAEELASIGDIYVMDAFGTAHRAHASTYGAIERATIACAGPLLSQEIDTLQKVLVSPARPLVAVIGGAKVSGKLEVLKNLSRIADAILVGGGMANTFLLAHGYPTGNSLVESDLTDLARSISRATNVPLPSDVMTSRSIEPSSKATLRLVDDVRDDDLIVDIGPITARQFASHLRQAGTILWNGPMGVFEFDQFGEGTRIVAEAVASSDGFTLGGGGDTIAALEHNGLRDHLNYVSTGGGAFLEFVEGRKLPSIAALEGRCGVKSRSQTSS